MKNVSGYVMSITHEPGFVILSLYTWYTAREITSGCKVSVPVVDQLSLLLVILSGEFSRNTVDSVSVERKCQLAASKCSKDCFG